MYLAIREVIAVQMHCHSVFVSHVEYIKINTLAYDKNVSLLSPETFFLFYKAQIHFSLLLSHTFLVSSMVSYLHFFLNLFVAQTCHDAGKHAGCCVLSSTQSCFVPGGRCYCDSYCTYYNDCCTDVSSSVSYQYCGKQTRITNFVRSAFIINNKLPLISEIV